MDVQQILATLLTAAILPACGSAGAPSAQDPPRSARGSEVEATAGGQGSAAGDPQPEPTAKDQASCSAAGLGGAAAQPQGLPEAVAQTLDDLRTRAVACDYAGLAELTSDDAFTFSYGDGGDPAEFWAAAEAAGDDPMRRLVEVTRVPGGRDAGGTYVWPRVHAEPDDEQAWAEIADVYAPAELDAMRQAGSGYLGYRIGISPEGSWIFFVAGD